MAQNKGGGGAMMRLVLLGAGLVGGYFIFRHLGSGAGTEWVDRFVRDQGLPGEAIFVAIGIAATAAGIPRQAVGFLAGYAFGAQAGIGVAIALALLAQLGGAILTFFWAREVGQDWAQDRLRGRYGQRLQPLQDILLANSFSSILALRLFPIGNNLALNLLSGVAGVGFLPFVLASAIGYLPQTVIFALMGEGMAVEEGTRMGAALALFVVSAVIGYLLLRRHRAAQVMAQENEPEQPDPYRHRR